MVMEITKILNLSSSTSDFKTMHSFQERQDQSSRILEKYPDRIPIICEKNNKNTSTPSIDKNKYLIPIDLTIGQFMYVIRKRLHLAPEQAIYFFIKGMIPATSQHIWDTYNKYKDDDGFLYITYSCENTFG